MSFFLFLGPGKFSSVVSSVTQLVGPWYVKCVTYACNQSKCCAAKIYAVEAFTICFTRVFLSLQSSNSLRGAHNIRSVLWLFLISSRNQKHKYATKNLNSKKVLHNRSRTYDPNRFWFDVTSFLVFFLEI